MATVRRAGHNAGCTERRGLQALTLIAASLLTLFTLGVDAMAQDSPQPTPTPHWITAPSLPVRGRIVRSTPIPAGAKVPTPGIMAPPEHLIGVTIDGYRFLMHPGPCAHRVEAAIRAHQDKLTGENSCDAQIRQARAIQRQKEAEDPAYANELRVTPAPTPDLSGDDETH